MICQLERQIPVLKVVRLNRTGVTEKSLDNQLIIEGFLFSYTLDN